MRNGAVLVFGKKKTLIKIEGEVIAGLGNGKVFRVGGSDAVSIPSEWQMLLDMKDCPVEKKLLKVKVTYGRLGPLKLASLETHILLIAPEGFPFDTFERSE